MKACCRIDELKKKRKCNGESEFKQTVLKHHLVRRDGKTHLLTQMRRQSAFQPKISQNHPLSQSEQFETLPVVHPLRVGRGFKIVVQTGETNQKAKLGFAKSALK